MVQDIKTIKGFVGIAKKLDIDVRDLKGYDKLEDCDKETVNVCRQYIAEVIDTFR